MRWIEGVENYIFLCTILFVGADTEVRPARKVLREATTARFEERFAERAMRRVALIYYYNA
jgi:hypothetical protein